MDKDEQVSSKVGKEILRQVKQRQNQYLFRKMVLSNYGGRCCVSGLPVQAALRASHIVGWAEDETIRMLPTNGLCLSATYDAVFDEHLLSFDEDYRMILSPSLHEYFGNQAFMVMFKKYEGKRMLIAIMVGMVMGARPLILIESVHSPPGAPRPPLPEGGSLGSEGQTLITLRRGAETQSGTAMESAPTVGKENFATAPFASHPPTIPTLALRFRNHATFPAVMGPPWMFKHLHCPTVHRAVECFRFKTYGQIHLL